MRRNSRRLWHGMSFVAAGLVALAGLALAQDRGAVCRDARADGGASVPFDVETLAKAYRSLAASMARRADLAPAKLKALADMPVDIGIPGCRFGGRKTDSLAKALPESARGRSFLFVLADDPDAAERLAKRYPDAHVLVVRARKLADLGDLASRVRRPVDAATQPLADALRVRCAPCVVTVNPKGDTLELLEGPLAQGE